MDYSHTQIGKVAAIVIAWGVIVVFIIAATAEEGGAIALAIGLFFALLAALAVVFSRLTIIVAAGVVKAAFGWGWPRRTVEVPRIAGFRRVRNKWYYGWGIRKIPGGWMFNVWGLDAVEVVLHSGKKFRLGTDEPDELIAALTLHTSLKPESDS
jgi:hypothetical protein